MKNRNQLWVCLSVKFIKDLQVILKDFNEEEQIQIIDTLFKIVALSNQVEFVIPQELIGDNKNSELFEKINKIYEEEFLKRFKNRWQKASNIGILQYFSVFAIMDKVTGNGEWDFCTNEEFNEMDHQFLSRFELTQLLHSIKNQLNLEKNNIYLKPKPSINIESKTIKLTGDLRKIVGRLNDSEINKFFSFLYTEKIYQNAPILTHEDVKKLLINGLSITDQPSGEYFNLNISTNQKGIIQYCFYKLYEKHRLFDSIKKDILQFLINNFTQFKGMDIEKLNKNTTGERPKRMKIIIDNYLP
jgi:hypothetical protein